MRDLEHYNFGRGGDDGGLENFIVLMSRNIALNLIQR